MDYDQYLKSLNEYTLEEKEEKIKDCCPDKKIIIDESNNIEICKNCGNTEIYQELIQENYLTQTNPYYRLTSIIPYSYRHRNIYRLQKWNNYSYKENTAIKSYNDIREFGLKIGLSNDIINNAIQLYKHFYYEKEISTRNKIKRSLYIYCLFYYSFEDNFFNIFKVLEDNNLSIKNFNKAIIRTDINKYFLQQNMEKYIDLIQKNYQKQFKLKDIIIKYNFLLKKNNKFNTNSILILVFFKLLNIKDNEKFFNLFNISKFTLKKIFKNN